MGLARTFQQPVAADTLTVLENAYLAASFRRGRTGRRSRTDDVAAGEAALKLVGLEHRATMAASQLPVYDKKRLMIATALATEPLVLLLDEPFGGLNPREIDDTLALLRRVRETGVAIVCIEHVMRALVALADRVLVMHHGAELFVGTPAEMMRDQRVIDVYLGASGIGCRMSAALDVSGLVAGYDRTVVVRDLSLSVEAGKTAVVIGPNGHGKTTMLLAISGLIKPMSGTVTLGDERIDGSSAESIAGRGVVHIMQGDGLFADMTVEENLLMGAFVSSSWRGRRADAEAGLRRPAGDRVQA